MDVHTKEQRSYNMSQIKWKNTKPELKLRKLLWNNGIRGYRLNAKLPGRPDIYFPKKKLAIFVDGCFWHKCPKCYVRPKTRKKFWDEKIKSNIVRDRKNNLKFKRMGIVVIRLWQHEINQSHSSCINKVLRCTIVQ